MKNYEDLLKTLRTMAKVAYVCEDTGGCDSCEIRESCWNITDEVAFHTVETAINAIQDLKKELRLCRNELCQHCGEYICNHDTGYCDDCRWHEVEHE